MDSKNIEVELRALVETTKLTQLWADCHQAGATVTEEYRLLIDFSTYLEGVANRTRDIRVRFTNGVGEIIAKEGDFAQSSRRESAVLISAPAEQILTTMAYMGFRRGVLAIRHNKRFSLNGIEYAVQEVRRFDNPSETYAVILEAEVMATSRDERAALTKIKRALERYELAPLTGPDWYDLINQLNLNANGVYDFDSTNWTEFRSLARSN